MRMFVVSIVVGTSIFLFKMYQQQQVSAVISVPVETISGTSVANGLGDGSSQGQNELFKSAAQREQIRREVDELFGKAKVKEGRRLPQIQKKVRGFGSDTSGWAKLLMGGKEERKKSRLPQIQPKPKTGLKAMSY